MTLRPLCARSWGLRSHKDECPRCRRGCGCEGSEMTEQLITTDPFERVVVTLAPNGKLLVRRELPAGKSTVGMEAGSVVLPLPRADALIAAIRAVAEGEAS